VNILALLISIAAALVIGLVALPKAIDLSFRYGLLDMPGHHKRHDHPTPVVGGLVLFAAVWGGVLITVPFFPNVFAELVPSWFFVFSGALMICLVGLSDDLKPLSVWAKLGWQLAVGLLVYIGGLRVELITLPSGSIEIGWLSVVITVLWVVGMTNAINLIDGLDGLAGGVSLIAAVTMTILGQIYSVGSIMAVMGGLLGFLPVFLWYNRYPARIFLGDSGSMQLGYYFAVFSLVVPLKSYTATALYLPLLVLGVPITEAASSMVRRAAAGRHPFRADRRHLFHYLAMAGLSSRQTVAVFYLLGLVFGGFSVAAYFWNRVVVFGTLVVFMVVIFVVFFIFVTNVLPRRRPSGEGSRNRNSGESET